MTTNRERVWFQDLPGLFTSDNYYRVVPDKGMSLAEQLNAAMRFATYFVVIMFAVERNANVGFVLLFVAGVTYAVWRYKTSVASDLRETMETLDLGRTCDGSGGTCTLPTPDNPFMNRSVFDRQDRPNACSDGPKVDQMTRQYFDAGLFRSADDVFHKEASDRQFYTVPGGDFDATDFYSGFVPSKTKKEW